MSSRSKGSRRMKRMKRMKHLKPPARAGIGWQTQLTPFTAPLSAPLKETPDTARDKTREEPVRLHIRESSGSPRASNTAQRATTATSGGTTEPFSRLCPLDPEVRVVVTYRPSWERQTYDWWIDTARDLHAPERFPGESEEERMTRQRRDAVRRWRQAQGLPPSAQDIEEEVATLGPLGHLAAMLAMIRPAAGTTESAEDAEQDEVDQGDDEFEEDNEDEEAYYGYVGNVDAAAAPDPTDLVDDSSSGWYGRRMGSSQRDVAGSTAATANAHGEAPGVTGGAGGAQGSSQRRPGFAPDQAALALVIALTTCVSQALGQPGVLLLRLLMELSALPPWGAFPRDEAMQGPQPTRCVVSLDMLTRLLALARGDEADSPDEDTEATAEEALASDTARPLSQDALAETWDLLRELTFFEVRGAFTLPEGFQLEGYSRLFFPLPSLSSVKPAVAAETAEGTVQPREEPKEPEEPEEREETWERLVRIYDTSDGRHPDPEQAPWWVGVELRWSAWLWRALL